MAARAPRLLSAATAVGLLTGSLLLGAGVAAANPVPQPPGGGTVAASCGQTVSAYPGDRVLVTPTIGPAFTQSVVPGMDTITRTVAGLLCSVQVTVLQPVQQQLQQVAPPLAAVTAPVTEGLTGAPASGTVPAPAQAQAAPQQFAAAPDPYAGTAPVTELPAAPAPAPALSPGQMAANAPLFAPSFSSGLPSSFLSSATPTAGYGAYGTPAASPFGSAFPGLSAGAPTGFGTTPAAAVTTASQVQALPVQGLSEGVGLPAILAVLAASGAAALAVRRMVLGRSLLPAGVRGGTAAPATGTADEKAPAHDAAELTTVTGAPGAAEATGVMAPVGR